MSLPRRMYFTEEEIERIVSYSPHENQRNQDFVDDANVRHRGTEIYSRLGVVSEIFDFNFDIEEMMTRYAPEISPDVVFRLTLRRIMNHLLTVSFGTLTTENQLFRIFFDKFPETEYTTPTITRHDLTVDRMYDKINEHLQSNDQIAMQGVWNGYMVVSRLVVDRRRRNRRQNQCNEDDVAGDVNYDAILEGRGKIENYREKLGLIKVDVQSHCLGHSVLLSMSLNEKSELYRAFMASYDRYLKIVMRDRLIEIENSCKVLSQNDDIKMYSMKKLQNNYLKEKNFGLVVYSQKSGKIERVYFERKSNNVILFHNNNHFDVVQNLGLFLHGRKINFCSKCFEKVKDANNHLCYDQINCFKCRHIHPVNVSFEGHAICLLCNCVFDNQFCLISHYKKSLVVGIKNFMGKKNLSPCDLFFFCSKCGSVVRKFYYVNSKGTKKNMIVLQLIVRYVKRKDLFFIIVSFLLTKKEIRFIQKILMRNVKFTCLITKQMQIWKI